MTYDEQETLIEAMSIHFVRSKTNLRMLAKSGGSPWKNVVHEFYRVYPNWTVQGWRSRPTTLYVPSVESLPPVNRGIPEETMWKCLEWGVVVIVILAVWWWYQLMAGPR